MFQKPIDSLKKEMHFKKEVIVHIGNLTILLVVLIRGINEKHMNT